MARSQVLFTAVIIASVVLVGCGSQDEIDTSPASVEQMIRQSRDLPMRDSMGPIFRALATQSVFVGTEDVTPTRDGKIVGTIALKTGVDKDGHVWVYAYTSEAEFTQAFPNGSPYALMEFPQFFQLVDRNKRFRGIFLNSMSDASMPIPRELFDDVKRALP